MKITPEQEKFIKDIGIDYDCNCSENAARRAFEHANETINKFDAETRRYIEIRDEIQSENERLKSDLRVCVEALEKADEMIWFDPMNQEGACSVCDANLHPNCMGMHCQLNGDACAAQIIHNALSKLTTTREDVKGE